MTVRLDGPGRRAALPLILMAVWLVPAMLPAAAAAQTASTRAAEPATEAVIPVPSPGQFTVAPDPDWWQAIPNQRGADPFELGAGRIYATSSPLWVEGGYWHAWIRGNRLPPLVTTSPAGTPRANAGVLGAPGTQVVFGNRSVDGGGRGGFRVSLGARLGYWFDRWMDSELEASIDWLGDGLTSGQYQGSSTGTPILARPFLDVSTGLQNAHLVAFPSIASGRLSVDTDSELLSVGLRLRHLAWQGPRGRWEWIAGYRYLQFTERLSWAETFESGDPAAAVPVGTIFDLTESVATWNEFHGADLGLGYWTDVGRWTVRLQAKLALGANLRTVQRSGETEVSPPGGTASVTAGGLLVLPSNIGRVRSNRFTAAPECSIEVRRRLSHSFILLAGYQVLIINRVARTGDQLDLAVNPTQMGNGALVGAARPGRDLGDSAIWVHGFHVGLEW